MTPVDEWEVELNRREALEASMEENQRLRADRDRLREALERIDAIDETEYGDGLIGAQRIAREALTPQPGEDHEWANCHACGKWAYCFITELGSRYCGKDHAQPSEGEE